MPEIDRFLSELFSSFFRNSILVTPMEFPPWGKKKRHGQLSVCGMVMCLTILIERKRKLFEIGGSRREWPERLIMGRSRSQRPGWRDTNLRNDVTDNLKLCYCSQHNTIQHNTTLVMVWDVNDACPGHFLQLFHPLRKVSFTSSSMKATFARHAVKVYGTTSNSKFLFTLYFATLWYFTQSHFSVAPRG